MSRLPEQLTPHLTVLVALGYLGRGGFSESVLENRGRQVQRYQDIRSLPPHERGIQFQKLIAEIAKLQGWEQEEGVQTSNEEIDVIIYREREFYLIECKWLKEGVETKEVDVLHGKVSKRAR